MIATVLVLAGLLAVAVLITLDARGPGSWDPWAEFDEDERP